MAISSKIRLPNSTQRAAIIGRTGSGKTVQAFWLLSLMPFDKMPYTIVDYKGDELLNSTDRIKEIGFNEVPKHPGIYRLSPRADENEQVEEWLWKVWQRENHGLVVDEGYMLPDKNAFTAILTQGRSKHIPVICLTQRPSWISRFVFSEADYYSVMHLNERNDRKRVQEFIPKDRHDIEKRLPDYHSYWYDVKQDHAAILGPVENVASISERIHDALKPKRRIF